MLIVHTGSSSSGGAGDLQQAVAMEQQKLQFMSQVFGQTVDPTRQCSGAGGAEIISRIRGRNYMFIKY